MIFPYVVRKYHVFVIWQFIYMWIMTWGCLVKCFIFITCYTLVSICILSWRAVLVNKKFDHLIYWKSIQMIAYMLIGKLFSHLKFFTTYVCLNTLIVLKKQLKELACADFCKYHCIWNWVTVGESFKLTTNDTM